MNELALFSGVGGGILGGTLCGFKTVCAVEIDPYCREVLLQRQRDRVLPLFPIWDDAKTFNGKQWRGTVDIITAGFPCQPFSVAGKNKGEQDERNMWPETIRIIREVGSPYVLLENVPGLLVHTYFGTILGQLAESGYDCQWTCLGANDIGANHRRKRVWILGNTKYNGSHESKIGECSIQRSDNYSKRTKQTSESKGSSKQYGNVADSISNGRVSRSVVGCEASHKRQDSSGEGEQKSYPSDIRQSGEDVANSSPVHAQRFKNRLGKREFGGSGWWKSEPRLGRVANGVANRVDRLKAIGNGQVPAVVKAVWEMLKC